MGKISKGIFVRDTVPDTKILALYVISGAAYRISQRWEGDEEDWLKSDVVRGLNTDKPEGSHKIIFENALDVLVSGIIWAALAPMLVYSKRDLKCLPNSKECLTKM